MAGKKITDLTDYTGGVFNDTNEMEMSVDVGLSVFVSRKVSWTDILASLPVVMSVAFGDETTIHTTGTKVTFHMPFAMNLTDVKVGLTAFGTGAVQSNGTVTCASAIATDTVTVNGLTYTAVSGVKADNTEFSIDTSDTATATDLADSITNDTRTGTDVAVLDQTATSSIGVVTITASAYGVAGDSILLSSSNGTRLAVSGANLANGVNAFTVDLNEAGTSVLSTKITVDNSEYTSGTAITQPVISDTTLIEDSKMTVDIDSMDAGGLSAGGKIYLIGTRA